MAVGVPGRQRTVRRHKGRRLGPQWRPPRPHQWYWHGRWVGRVGQAFFYPRGYAYQRWSAGALLPAIFLSTAYFYDGYAPLGLYAPPPGFRWVSYIA